MRTNREIRAPRVRVIDKEGQQLGILTLLDAIARAEHVGLDLVEISPSADPPVCKIIDFGKYRYQQTKKEKENNKSQHRVKVKEVKVKPNTDDHDIETKLRHAREFIAKGNKVKITCTYRGREMAHPELGLRVVQKLCEKLGDIAAPEAPPKFFGKALNVILAPGAKKKL